MRQNNSLILDGFDLGLWFGVLLGGTLPFIIIIGLNADGLSKWQELIGAVLTLIGAGGAVFAIFKQIKHAQYMEDERRERQLYAARSMMSHALLSLCDYAQGCCQVLSDIIEDHRAPDSTEPVAFPSDFQLPQLPNESMKPLYQLLEFGDAEIQNAISNLMRFLPIQWSRGNIKNDELTGHQYYNRITEALEIYARASALFPYARRISERSPETITSNDMQSAANNCGFLDIKWNNLRQHIEENWEPYQPFSN